jgi:quinol-cytochrome oxidoreductase complex cytochrome b subunit
MPVVARQLPRWVTALDRWANRLYGSRGNPLYQSGTIVGVLLLVLLITGVWLLLFYRIAAPWESVARLTENRWTGSWVRGLHRYASAAALVFSAWHALRMFLQRRTWGPRLLAWLSGVALLGLLFACGWTGYVMVWDRFGYELAIEGARALDALPILSEPLRRAFVGDQPVPGVFFMNLFLHVGLPLGLGLGLWLHVSRLSRPTLIPPRPVWIAVVTVLTVVSIGWPPPVDPEANPSQLTGRMAVDWLYAFWLPLHRSMPPAGAWLGAGGLVVLLLAVPWLRRPRVDRRPAPARLDSRLCTGCRQCALDCPYEVVVMVPRVHGLGELIAKVNAERCVSCGICAAACDVFAIGPPGRVGNDQVETARSLLPATLISGRPVVVGCHHATTGRLATDPNAVAYPIACAGSLHRSVIEDLLERGAVGVTIVPCNARDCWHREGAKWLAARVAGQRQPAPRPAPGSPVTVIEAGVE